MRRRDFLSKLAVGGTATILLPQLEVVDVLGPCKPVNMDADVSQGLLMWKQYSSSVVISGRELRTQNDIFPLLDAKIDDACRSMHELMTTQMYDHYR